jgi:hypothetical protein
MGFNHPTAVIPLSWWHLSLGWRLEETLNITNIIEQIDAEISKLQTAKALLTGAVTKSGPGRPKKSASVSAPVNAKPSKRVVSAEAKEKMAAAQKKRWAKVRSASKKAAKAEAAA